MFTMVSLVDQTGKWMKCENFSCSSTSTWELFVLLLSIVCAWAWARDVRARAHARCISQDIVRQWHGLFWQRRTNILRARCRYDWMTIRRDLCCTKNPNGSRSFRQQPRCFNVTTFSAQRRQCDRWIAQLTTNILNMSYYSPVFDNLDSKSFKIRFRIKCSRFFCSLAVSLLRMTFASFGSIKIFDGFFLRAINICRITTLLCVCAYRMSRFSSLAFCGNGFKTKCDTFCSNMCSKYQKK